MSEIVAPMGGKVLEVKVNVGDAVNDGDEVIILEAMKMELPVVSEASGTTSSPSALAKIHQLPTDVSVGIVTVVDPVLLASAASEGTLRFPNRVSDGSMVLSVDR